MWFLADECCPGAVVTALRAAGHDTVYAAEDGARSVDYELLARAARELRVLVTEDFDFGDLVFRDGHPACGIIILFLPEFSPVDRASRLLHLLALGGFDPTGKLTIVESSGVRQRLLPQAPGRPQGDQA